jgi:hypothetical protein
MPFHIAIILSFIDYFLSARRDFCAIFDAAARCHFAPCSPARPPPLTLSSAAITLSLSFRHADAAHFAITPPLFSLLRFHFHFSSFSFIISSPLTLAAASCWLILPPLALLRLFAYAFVIDFHFFISFISYFRH